MKTKFHIVSYSFHTVRYVINLNFYGIKVRLSGSSVQYPFLGLLILVIFPSSFNLEFPVPKINDFLNRIRLSWQRTWFQLDVCFKIKCRGSDLHFHISRRAAGSCYKSLDIRSKFAMT